MNNLMQLLSGASPFISTFIYDVLKRNLVIELVDDPEKMNPVKRLIFSDIISYAEEDLGGEVDDECIDSVIGIDWIDDASLCLKTDNKEIILKVGTQPFSEFVAQRNF